MNTKSGNTRKSVTPEETSKREEKRRKSFRNWYQNNKERLAATRKRRYREDPKYFAMRKKHAISTNRGTAVVPVYPRIGDQEYKAYRIGAVATMLGVNPSHIRVYIKKGLIPESSFPDYKLRAFTEHQVELVSLLLNDPNSPRIRAKVKKEWEYGISDR